MKIACGWMQIAVLLAAPAAAEPVAATIDATRKGEPISRLLFGGFMEPATTRVWAEMLYDRKFFYEINSKPLPATRSAGFGRRGPLRRWLPVGADAFVVMDANQPYVGEWSPRVKLEEGSVHGISQSGIALRAGKAYSGRVALSASAGTKVEISLIWGSRPEDRQTVILSALTAKYAKYPLKFVSRGDTGEGRFEVTATGTGALHIGAVSLMPADHVSGFKPDMVRLLKGQGIGIARWPGGNFVSAYDWRDGLGDADLRPPRRELAWNGMEPNDMGIDDFMTLCRLLGCEPYIAVNTGLGDAHSAAEEVEYVNGPATSRMGQWRARNGHPEPYGVKIWGIGNEMYGPWQWGHMAVDQYPEKHNLVVKAMRAVDPKVKVIASSATPEELSWTYIENRQLGTFPERETVSDKLPFGFGTKYDWTGWLLSLSSRHIDYLGEHFYGYPNLAVDEATGLFVESHDPMEDRVRRMANKVVMKFEAWEEYQRRMPGLKDSRIQFAFDEWAPRNRPVSSGAPLPAAPNAMLNPLSNALVYHEFFRHSGMSGLAVATGGMGWLATDSYGDPVGYRLEGQVARLLHDHFAGAVPLQVDGQSPQRRVKGMLNVDLPARTSGSPTWPLDVAAALSADGKKIVVSLVNASESAQECSLKLNGKQAAGGAKQWQLTAPAATASAQTAAPGGFGFGPAAEVAEKTLSQAPGVIALPASSMTVLEFDVK